MKGRNGIARSIAILMCACLYLGILPTSAFAASELTESAEAEDNAVLSTSGTSEDSTLELEKGSTIEGTDYLVTSVKNYTVAPDITETTITTNNSDGSSQTVANVMEINTTNGYAKIVAGYGNLNPAADGWTFATTSAQAHKYEEAYDENVVGGINASFFNITTGEPTGSLVMRGVTYKEDSGKPYIAVFSDGSTAIFKSGTSLASAAEQQSKLQGTEVTVEEAIAGYSVLVWDGEVYDTGNGNDGYYSRSAVGIKADGTIVFLQADGTMAPRSVGYTKEEEAYMLIALGCVYAIRLDEGGSSTFVSQREGEDDVTMRNTAAGGSERGVSETILVVSTAPSDGEFDHVNITPNDEIYTPNTEVELTATGMDYSGALADAIPDSVTWELAEGSEDMGELVAGAVSGDQATAAFVSNGTCGTVTVNMIYNDTIVGSTDIRIQNPDELSFTSDETNLNYGEESDLGLVAKYQDEEMNLKDGDITWNITDESAGTFKGNTFIATSDTTVSASATVTAVYGDLTASTIINIGKEPTIIMDGGDEDGWDYSTIGTTVTSFDGLASDAVATYHYSGRGGVVTGSVVSDTDEDYADVVRFGHNAIKLEFDWTGINGTDGACLGLGGSIEVTGSPTAIGVWVYIPDESTPIPWLRAQIATSTDGGSTWTNAYINFNNGSSSDSMQVGWQYLEADLTAYAGSLIRVNSGMLFRAMVTTSGTGWYTVNGTKLDKSELTGYLILDNICFVYGSNNQDTTNPTVSSISLIEEDGTKTELENGAVVSTNDLIFYATYDDNEDTDAFAAGIESAYFYLDGTYYGTGDQDNLGSTLITTMANGSHSITFYLKDAYGNVTRETRYFTVEAEESTLTNVDLQVENTPVIDSEWEFELISNNSADIASMEATISVTKSYAVSNVTFADGVTGTYTYDASKGTLTISVSEVDGAAVGETLATVSVTIPNTVTQGASVTIQVTKGTYETVADTDYWKGFSTNLLTYTIGADYVLTTNTLIAGMPGTISVASDDLPTAGLSVYCDSELIGTTDENGQLITSDLTATAGEYILYAVDEDGSQSYPVTVTVYTAAGEEDGSPYYILTNVTSDASAEKNISWMSNPLYSDETAQIKISTNADMTDAAITEGTSTVVTYTGSSVANRSNSVYVTGLEAETTYYYQAGDGTTWSEVSSFTTAQADDEQTNFFVLADIQENDAITGMQRIAAQLVDTDYDFGVQLGDAVDNVRYYNQWEAALELFTLEGVAGTDLLHVIGNHEADDDGNSSYAAKSIFNLEGDWYSVEYGDVYIAVLNYTQNSEKLEAFKEWLIADAAETECTWKILVSHVPVYYTNPTGGGTTYLEALPDAIEEAGIDFYLSGNDHSYARTAPLTDGEVDEEDGVVYYICGSTGGKSYSIVNNDAFHFEIATLDFESVYMSVSADESQITLTAYNVDEDGNATVLDTYTKTQKYCENDEHVYIYDRDTDELTCANCPFHSTMAEEKLSGFVTDIETGRIMYMVAGNASTGLLYMNNTAYYFDDEGLAYEDGTYTICGETCTMEDGVIVSWENSDILAIGFAGDNIGFVLYTDGSMKLEGTGKMWDFSSYGNTPWAGVRNSIKSITIGYGITYIGGRAFQQCKSLKSVSFTEESTVTVIAGSAFLQCTSLAEIVLPDSLTKIYGAAFQQCTSLSSVYLPDGVNYIASNAFYKSSNVVLSVGYESYAKQYAIDNSIAYVEREQEAIASGTCGTDASWALYSDGVLKISGSGAMSSYSSSSRAPWYSYRNSITAVIFGENITTVGGQALAYCKNLTSVTFEGESISYIGGSAFLQCTSLTEVILPDGVKTIYGAAFQQCTSLTYVYIPDSVSSISSNAFKNCTNVTLSVGYESYAKGFAVENNIVYIERERASIAYGTCGTNATWVLYSDGILEIDGSGAMDTYSSSSRAPWYSYRNSITAVIFGENITTVGGQALAYCKNLTSVTFEGESISYIAGSAFLQCTSLTEVILPDGVKSIFGAAFQQCTSLTYVYIPDSVSSITSNAFRYSTNVTLSVGYGSYAKQYAIDNSISFVERERTYIASGDCGTNATWVLYSDGILEISGSGAMTSYSGSDRAPWYAYRNSITSVVIGADITSIGSRAFNACKYLTTVTFEGAKVTAIGGSAFYDCVKLTEITLPESVTVIYGTAFGNCTSLEKVVMPSGITEAKINTSSFRNCSNVVLYVAQNSGAYDFAVNNGLAYVIKD